MTQQAAAGTELNALTWRLVPSAMVTYRLESLPCNIPYSRRPPLILCSATVVHSHALRSLAQPMGCPMVNWDIPTDPTPRNRLLTQMNPGLSNKKGELSWTYNRSTQYIKACYDTLALILVQPKKLHSSLVRNWQTISSESIICGKAPNIEVMFTLRKTGKSCMMMCQLGWSLRRGTDGLFPLPPTSGSGSAVAVASWVVVGVG